MERVAETGLKLDLHIHSQNSRGKDGKKVKNNTLENIPILVSKLNEQGVNICAITDHDAFSYQMYELLKNEENKGSVLKVFPGVEFSVRFRTDEEREIHIVAVFSDEEEEKIKRINELYHKAKAEGLTPDEAKEQQELRSEYIANIRASLRGQLNNIDIQNEDGSVENLGEKFGQKKVH